MPAGVSPERTMYGKTARGDEVEPPEETVVES
jgi:hypothetical protein